MYDFTIKEFLNIKKGDYVKIINTQYPTPQDFLLDKIFEVSEIYDLEGSIFIQVFIDKKEKILLNIPAGCLEKFIFY